MSKATALPTAPKPRLQDNFRHKLVGFSELYSDPPSDLHPSHNQLFLPMPSQQLDKDIFSQAKSFFISMSIENSDSPFSERKAGGSWDRTVDIRNISAGLPLQPIDPNVFRS